MRTKAIRKRHELFIHGTQKKFILLTVVAVAVILTLIIIIASSFKGIIT